MKGRKKNQTSLLSLIFLCFSCSLWPLLSACSRHADADGQVLRVSQRNEPATLDPQLATLPDEFFVIRALSEGLLAPAPGGGAPVPAAATSWSVSPDGLVYTFELRPDSRWSNGDPVIAGDFVFSIHRILSPTLAAPKAALFFPLKNAAAFYHGNERDFSRVGVRAVNDRRLEFTLEQPMPDFPALVASGPWIPVHPATIGQHGQIDERDTPWTWPGNYAGNGPFTLTAWHPNQEISVTRNPAYHGATQVQLQQVRFLAFDDRDSEERAFRSGQVDVTMDVPFTKLAAYRTAQPPVLHTVPLHETRYLALNVTRAPLNDVRVRRALSLAIDRTAIVEKVLLGGQRPAVTFIPPGLGGYQPAAPRPGDLAEARRLLAEAGFPGGAGFPRLELATWVNSPVLEAIQQMWRERLGIDVSVAQREARIHLASLAAGDFALGLVPAIPDYDSPADLFERFTSSNPANYPHWADPGYDRQVAAAGRLASAPERNAAYQRAEQSLLDAAPVIPLYFNTQNFLVRPPVQGWQGDALWTRFYQNIHVDEK